eukprot:5747881-Prymnesium_polylepis.1
MVLLESTDWYEPPPPHVHGAIPGGGQHTTLSLAFPLWSHGKFLFIEPEHASAHQSVLIAEQRFF